MTGTEEGAKWRYDVFLSYKIMDTRHTFTGNLYNALRLKRFKIVMDDNEWIKGEEIATSVLKTLEESRISIVVLSEHYAQSRWCLDELAKSLDCRNTKGQLVVPIFYNVDPSDVRKQCGSYGEAMNHHEKRFEKDRVEMWKTALTEIGCISGWHFRFGYDYEYELIQKIVEWVIKTVPRYDVFLSFSGKDTRYSFTGYLYNTLCREGFKTFMNDEVLGNGNQISQSIVQVIEKSRLSIIVLSENYAHSSSSLDELVMILDCMDMKKHLVWPIFYKVEPSDIRHQRNSYDKAMIAHEKMFGQNSEKVQKWRLALSQVANLKGWHLKTGYEYELIERIVEIAIKI